MTLAKGDSKTTMRLGVAVPTYRRPVLLAATLDSLLAASVPEDLDVEILVVDNAGTPATREVVESRRGARSVSSVSYVSEEQQGLSFARNRALEELSAVDLVGFMDDDMEVDRDWYGVVSEVFRNLDADFIGGPYVPKWESPPPDWLPEEYPAVVGRVELGDRVRRYGEDSFDGMLMGANAVFRRQIFEQLGHYSELLGRSGERLLSCEDHEMFLRLEGSDFRGYYVPRLVAHHFVPTDRLTKSYHRSWCFWHAVSRATMNVVLDRKEPDPYFAGVPRHLFRGVLEGLEDVCRSLLRGSRDAETTVTAQLRIWELAGWLYGTWVYSRRVN